MFIYTVTSPSERWFVQLTRVASTREQISDIYLYI